jgi:hypothetical protein
VIDLQQALESEGHGGNGSDSISRRQFIKRSGGATVATLVAFSLAERAEARVGPPNSSSSSWGGQEINECERIRCTSDPNPRNGTGSTIVGDIEVLVQWRVAGAVTGQTAPIPMPLPMALGASVTVIQHLPGGATVTIDQISFKYVDQEAACTFQCVRIFTPPHANGSWVSASGNTSLELKLHSGVVVQIAAAHGPSGASVNIPVSGLDWTFVCE